MRYNDNSCDHTRWSSEKLFRELRHFVNFEKFGSFFRSEPVEFGNQAESGEFIRNETRIYRETWIKPLIDEIERRLEAA